MNSTAKASSPLVTIGIPTYNRAASFLPETLKAALGQTYRNIEVFVADNASPDRTEEIAGRHVDPRLRYSRHREPVAPHENADFCLRSARGKYFILLHDDDLLDADFVETCVAAMEKSGAAFVQTGARTIGRAGQILDVRNNSSVELPLFDYFRSVLAGGAVTFFCNTLYNTKKLREVGGFRSKSYVYQDVVTNLRLARMYPRATIERPMASYRIHDSKLGRVSEIEKWCDDSLHILDVMCDLIPEEESFFRTTGKASLCRRNLGKRANKVPMPMRLFAYLIVFMKFRQIPVRFFSAKLIRQLPRMRVLRST